MSNSIMHESEVINQSANNASKTPIFEQFNKLKQLWMVNDTVKIFGTSLQLLFSLIRESTILIWLAICWGIVVLSYFSDPAQQIGARLKSGWNVFKELRKYPSRQEFATQLIQSTFYKSKCSLQNLVVEVKKQVGLKDSQ